MTKFKNIIFLKRR